MQGLREELHAKTIVCYSFLHFSGSIWIGQGLSWTMHTRVGVILCANLWEKWKEERLSCTTENFVIMLASRQNNLRSDALKLPEQFAAQTGRDLATVPSIYRNSHLHQSLIQLSFKQVKELCIFHFCGPDHSSKMFWNRLK